MGVREPVSVKTDRAAHSMQICRSSVARTRRKPQMRHRCSGMGGFASISAPSSKRRPGRVGEKVEMDKPHYWFRRTRFGWGLEPGSREGWIATVLFVIIAVGGVAALMPVVVTTRSWILVVWAIAWSVAFIAMVVAKGEKLW